MTNAFLSAGLTAALLLAASPLRADCPTGDDLGDGITLAQNTPYFMRSDFKSTEQGFVEHRVIKSGEDTRTTMALYRHGLAKVSEHSHLGHTKISYVDKVTPLDQLPEKGKVSISGIARGPKGESFVELELTFVQSGQRALAECRFDTWEVISSLRDRNGTGAAFRMHYAPELDLVLAVSALGEDGRDSPVFTYQWAGKTSDIAR